MDRLFERRGAPRRMGLAALTIVSAAAAACGQGKQTYELKTSDGLALPVAIEADSVCLVQMMGGTILLDGRNFNMDYRLRRVCPTGSTPITNPGSRGRFDMEPATITFRDTTGVPMSRGEVRGDTIVVAGTKHVLRFVKQK